MSFNFPNSPSEGQTFTPSGGYQYVYSGGVWRIVTNPSEYTTLNDQTGTSYTFALTDAGALVSGSNTAAITFTVPPYASVALLVKAKIDIWQKGAGQITVAPGAGVTLRAVGSRLKTASQYSAATLVKINTDEWLVFGDLTA